MSILHTTSLGKSPQLEGEGNESIDDKKNRCVGELIKAGMTNYGLRKFNTRYLPTIIHDYEHIQAVIYGRYTEGAGFLAWVDRMVVATDRRIISLNHKPGYTDIDEFTYDIVDGVEALTAGPFTAVKLNTKVSSFTVRFVNRACAERFVHYIEKRRIEFAQTPFAQFSSGRR